MPGLANLGKVETVYEKPLSEHYLLLRHLRFQEIAGALDSALMTTTLVPSQKSSNLESSQSLVLKQSISLMDCLRSCWRDDVLLLSCSDKFLRLFLQLLSRSVCFIVLLKSFLHDMMNKHFCGQCNLLSCRYSNWLSAGLGARKAGNAAASSGSEWAISASPDDFLYVCFSSNQITHDCSVHALFSCFPACSLHLPS